MRKGYEKKGSRVPWEKVDPKTEEQLVAKICKDSRTSAALTIIFSIVVFVFLFGLSSYFVVAIFDGSGSLAMFLPFLAAILFFGFIIGKQIIKSIPYLNPEKQDGIWIYRTCCIQTSTSRDDDGSESHYAHFDMDGEPIRISISRWEYEALGTDGRSKEYTFYKLNDKPGNPWKGFRTVSLEDDRAAS